MLVGDYYVGYYDLVMKVVFDSKKKTYYMSIYPIIELSF